MMEATNSAVQDQSSNAAWYPLLHRQPIQYIMHVSREGDLEPIQ